MSKRLMNNKIAIVWYAISSVVIIAGIILFALLGFNRVTEYPEAHSLEVRYDTFVTFYEKEGELRTFCEDALKANGYTAWEETVSETTNGGVVEYKLNSAEAAKMQAVKAAVEAKISTAITSGAWQMQPQTTVSYHTLALEDLTTAQWRGGVAIAVAAVVVLIYLAIRCGLGAAVSGLVACVHDFFFTLALLAVARIPVGAYMPMVFGGIAVLLSLFYHTAVSVLVRNKKKDSEYAGASAQEMVGKSVCTVSKAVLAVSVALVFICVLVGALVQGSVMAFMLPALVPVAVSAYSSLLLMPNIHAFLKSKFDRLATKRKRYERTKKVTSAEEQN